MSEPELNARCPNCGKPMPSAQSYCPNCGNMNAPSHPRTRRPGSGPTVVLVLLFIFVGLPAGAAGACFLVFAAGEPGFIAIGLGGAALAVALFVLMIRSMIVK